MCCSAQTVADPLTQVPSMDCVSPSSACLTNPTWLFHRRNRRTAVAPLNCAVCPCRYRHAWFQLVTTGLLFIAGWSGMALGVRLAWNYGLCCCYRYRLQACSFGCSSFSTTVAMAVLHEPGPERRNRARDWCCDADAVFLLATHSCYSPCVFRRSGPPGIGGIVTLSVRAYEAERGRGAWAIASTAACRCCLASDRFSSSPSSIACRSIFLVPEGRNGPAFGLTMPCSR